MREKGSWKILFSVVVLLLSEGCTGVAFYYFTGYVKDSSTNFTIAGVTVSSTNFDLHLEDGGSITKSYTEGVLTDAKDSFTVSSFVIYDCPIGCSKCSPPFKELNFGFYFSMEGYIPSETTYSGEILEGFSKSTSGAFILPDTLLSKQYASCGFSY